MHERRRSHGGCDDGPPNADLALAAMTTALGMPPGAAEAIFGIARCAGWLAHAFEQSEEGQLIRPRALYPGPGPQGAPAGGGRPDEIPTRPDTGEHPDG